MTSRRSAAEQPEPDGRRCVTCGDIADPVTVLMIDANRGLALCAEDDGAQVTVEIALVEPVADGDRLLVHAGTAIAHVAPTAAAA